MVDSEPSVAHEALCRLLKPLVQKWAGIRETFAFADPGDHDWAKGNGRWINGLSAEIEALDLRAFASAAALCDAVAERARTRPWDPDYDEPSSAREEVLAAVAQVRAERGAPQGGVAIEAAPAARPAISAGGTTLDPAGLTDHELAQRISEMSYLGTGMAANDVPVPPEWELECGVLHAEQARRRNPRRISSMRIVVVGATGTIGRAVADALSARHEVLRASRRGPIAVDITRPEAIREMYARVGKVDAVVSCAGSGVMKPLAKLSDEDIQRTLEDKLMGQVNLVRFGVDHLNDGGVFVLTAGIFSKSPMPGVSALAMVNGALESFARAAALDLPRGIRINTISPPFIKETAEAMGLPGGLPASENAKAYLALVESRSTGQVVFNG